MLPYLLRIPLTDRPLPAFGLLLGVGLLLGIWTTGRLAEREGIDKKTVYEFVFYLLPSCLLGTKLLMIVTEPHTMAGGWRRLLTATGSQALGAYWGGLLVALAMSVLLARMWRLPWKKIADASAPGLALGNVVGRIGCFLAGCCWGKPTTIWIGVRFTEQAHRITGVPADTLLLPTQLIEAAVNIFSFTLLFWLWRRRAFEGQIILAYLLLYSVERFVLDFLRADPPGYLLGISAPRLISTIIFGIAFTLTIYLRSRAQRRSGSSIAAFA